MKTSRSKTPYVKNYFFCILFLSLLMAACSGEDGAVGPAGPAGVDGAAGPQGETGAANVVYSNWIPETLTETLLQSAEMSLGSFSTDRSELDPDTDLVLVFGRRQTTGEFTNTYQLPYSDSESNSIITDHYGAKTGFNDDATAIEIWVIAKADKNDPFDNLGQELSVFNFFDAFRYIIIPGAQMDSASKFSGLDYTKMTYKEITEMFGLED